MSEKKPYRTLQTASHLGPGGRPQAAPSRVPAHLPVGAPAGLKLAQLADRAPLGVHPPVVGVGVPGRAVRGGDRVVGPVVAPAAEEVDVVPPVVRRVPVAVVADRGRRPPADLAVSQSPVPAVGDDAPVLLAHGEMLSDTPCASARSRRTTAGGPRGTRRRPPSPSRSPPSSPR